MNALRLGTRTLVQPALQPMLSEGAQPYITLTVLKAANLLVRTRPELGVRVLRIAAGL